jgi:hypothetical protein
MAEPAQRVHTPRFLHDSATSKSLSPERQRARKKPCAKIPHFKLAQLALDVWPLTEIGGAAPRCSSRRRR